MAGIEGFEPSHAGVKVLSLTAWLHPYIKLDTFFLLRYHCAIPQREIIGVEPITHRCVFAVYVYYVKFYN